MADKTENRPERPACRKSLSIKFETNALESWFAKQSTFKSLLSGTFFHPTLLVRLSNRLLKVPVVSIRGLLIPRQLYLSITQAIFGLDDIVQ